MLLIHSTMLYYRIETLKIKTGAGIAKLVGIIACLAGVATLALYKGPSLEFLSHHHLLNYHESKPHEIHESSSRWIKGCFLLLLSNTFFGLWLVLQGHRTMEVGLEYQASSCIILCNSLGIVVTGVTYCLQTWIIEKKGPVFLAMSSPLALIMTIISSALVLGVIIRLGSILGGMTLIVGLYCVLWGKRREQMPKSSLDIELGSG
ncbi:hypothetical protein Lalb_Chr11g0068231 [Lupinus albus]|uniref:WAT1-related protein n=1 Tax=Lupinus albus TaxID=3870 RepID=A0A6A4PSA9_LUPAL|nr:hypothetical protein Lalb_Chr11g0068231 [Lupinus albus]